MAYNAERIVDTYTTFLQENLADALDAVEVLWADDPVTLADPVTWYKGYNPVLLEMPSTSFPFVGLLAGERRPERGENEVASWGYQEQEVTLFIDYFVVGDSHADVNRMAYRYAEAICNVLQSEKSPGGYPQWNFEPLVSLYEAIKHRKIVQATRLKADDWDYLRGGRIATIIEDS